MTSAWANSGLPDEAVASNVKLTISGPGRGHANKVSGTRRSSRAGATGALITGSGVGATDLTLCHHFCRSCKAQGGSPRADRPTDPSALPEPRSARTVEQGPTRAG
jgi:hypothetical protein